MFLFPRISGEALMLGWIAKLLFATGSSLLLPVNGDAGDDAAFVRIKVLGLTLFLGSWQEELRPVLLLRNTGDVSTTTVVGMMLSDGMKSRSPRHGLMAY